MTLNILQELSNFLNLLNTMGIPESEIGKLGLLCPRRVSLAHTVVASTPCQGPLRGPALTLYHILIIFLPFLQSKLTYSQSSSYKLLLIWLIHC